MVNNAMMELSEELEEKFDSLVEKVMRSGSIDQTLYSYFILYAEHILYNS